MQDHFPLGISRWQGKPSAEDHESAADLVVVGFVYHALYFMPLLGEDTPAGSNGTGKAESRSVDCMFCCAGGMEVSDPLQKFSHKWLVDDLELRIWPIIPNEGDHYLPNRRCR